MPLRAGGSVIARFCQRSTWQAARRHAQSGASSLDQVERSSGDLLGVDAEMAVEVLHVAGLAEVVDAETKDLPAAERAEERERVWVAVEHGDKRRAALRVQP
jgi:hypothetical protein